MGKVSVKVGDLFGSSAQTLVNTVNCVGVMGKGIALQFRERFPDMFVDYQKRCARGEVELGQPYLWRSPDGPWILNFPTKEHWRGVSKVSDISTGLRYLREHYKGWGITSLAVPPLGCGNGQLDWAVVGPTLYRHLKQLDIPVELYAPHQTPAEQLTFEFLERTQTTRSRTGRDREPLRVDPAALAIVAVISRIRREKFSRPVGRITFQKIAYFLTELGIPTGLNYQRASYGPFSSNLKSVISRLVNNGLVDEHSDGAGRFSVVPGPTYKDTRDLYKEQLRGWIPQIERVADLLLRLPTTNDVELAATALFVQKQLNESGEMPSERAVLDGVMQWKAKRRPPVREETAANIIRQLAMLGWLRVQPSPGLPVSGVLAELEKVA